MTTTICRIIGAAGVGKTSHLMKVLTEWLENRNVNPFRVGFVSFTRAARGEAANRAAEIAGVGKDELEQSGWFRTVHSVAYRQLGVGKELLTDTKESRKWIADALGIGEGDTEIEDAEDQPTAVRDNASEEANALALWSVARARLEPLKTTWEKAQEINEFVPDWATVQNVIERYEQAKRLDGRCDFTDILGRYGGVRFEINGPCDKAHEGEIPGLPIWFLDEWQDASALLDRCARRMTDGANVVYVAADPFQAIYGFGGSNPKYFYDWEPTPGKERILNHSYRCPAEFIELGEDILRDCTDYWDRGVTPNGENGEIDVQMLGGGWEWDLDPRVKTLVIARSNAHVRRLIQKIDARGLPWLPTRGMGGKWAAPTRRSALLGLINLQHGDTIFANEWSAVMKLLPSKAKGEELIAHGGKTVWKDQERGSDERMDLAHLDGWFATPHLIELIRGGRWQSLIENGQGFFDAWKEWGEDAVIEPQIQIGTIHCSPPDELVRTKRGLVEIAELQPDDRLVGYERHTHTIVGESDHANSRGASFQRSVRPFMGELVRITTDCSSTRVTPNHRVIVSFDEENFCERWVVYLMRRGPWWRVGVCTSAHRPYRSGGVAGRLATEQADEGWILSVHDTRQEAVIAEAIVQMKHGIPGLTFESSKSRLLTREMLHAIHAEASSAVAWRVSAMLREIGLSKQWPLYLRGLDEDGKSKRNMRGWFITEAANLVPLSGRCRMAVFTDATMNQHGSKKPLGMTAVAEFEQYKGPVYGLDVPPYHYYISGGAVVHNSVKGAECDHCVLLTTTSRQCTKSYDYDEAADEERRVAYVAVTRARKRLTVLKEKCLHQMKVPV